MKFRRTRRSQHPPNPSPTSRKTGRIATSASPTPIQNLLTIARIKDEAASNQITSMEISGQRLMLQSNGSPILMDGSRHPRLTKTRPGEKLDEVLEMLRNF